MRFTGITKPQVLFPMFRFLPWQLIGRDNRCFQPALRKVFWVESYNEVSLPCSKHRQNGSSPGPGEISTEERFDFLGPLAHQVRRSSD